MSFFKVSLWPRLLSGQGIRSWLACNQSEPSTTKDPLCRGTMYTLNLSRAQTSSRWCGMVVRRGGASSGVVLVT
ncbi:hypothetical protein TNCV_74731 [Trichonephila clavipes]|nr:hypothetical protein TNCV_74731 [Trichonephila clavipes]